ncbi:uncharacterized protein B0J16DRAFT_319250 [Fusarium flagelliforme]|uniref:Uncharacterized protein n=1 Tax=Fusarium flagelliforme TaxID=2675880 RepID=A0A395MSX1_9HYPO|nr:uncharacterized protein B0J16DRAFT_319250 [Fusarium flagelliforme]KAH7189619.1 hypothetical protein B0J16DRAFT_319250 [Fusarium flagelliforme]RFN50269.1 hypothetical protein FIE12Z_5448 [Fusarium flagelliforme]
MTGRPRGRPPGPGKKRKSEDELSTNRHTKKARDRKASLSEEQWAYENARNNFNMQWSRLKKKLYLREDYQSADEATRATLEDTAFQEHTAKYTSLGKHPDQFKVEASSVTIGHAEDDDNSAWEDIEDHDWNDERQLVSTDQTTNFDVKESEVELESAGEMGELKHATRYVKGKLVDALESLWAKCITIKRHPSWVSAGAKEYRAEWKLIFNKKFPRSSASSIFSRIEMFVWLITRPKNLEASEPINRSYMAGAPSVIQMIQEMHCSGRRTATSWDHRPGMPCRWDRASVKQFRLLKAYVGHFDNECQDMFRIITGTMALRELSAKDEPWLALMDLDLLASEG